MNETPKQYIARLLGYIQGKKPLRVLGSTAQEISRLVKNSSRSRLTKRPKARKWSAAEIIAHLAETELVVGYRLRKVLEKNGTPIQAFDQNVWQKNAGYLHRNPVAALALFAVLRKNNLALLESIPRKKRQRYGMHVERGKETITRIMNLEAGHDINHLRQLRKLLAKKLPG